MAEQLKPDPVLPPPDDARLKRALESLTARTTSRARRSPSAPATARQAAPRGDALHDLRFAMALRGWCDPAALLPSDLDSTQRLALLESIACESDVKAVGAGSAWYLSDAARRRALRSRTPEEVAAALEAIGPEGDRCTGLLRALYTGTLRPLPSYSADDLRALAASADVTAGHAPHSVDVNEARRWAARKGREDGYRRLLSGGFFGRTEELQQLVHFLTKPLNAGAGATLSGAWVWGSGGIGKSTLLSAACLQVLEQNEHAALAHLDFDRSDLDPSRSYSLDLELLRQLGGIDAEVDRRLDDDRERIREQIGDELGSVYAANKARQTVNVEAAHASSRSILAGALRWLVERRMPLLLILDTWEQVQAGGPYYVSSLQSWLGDLAFSTGIPELRVVVCGRGAPVPLLPATGPILELPLAQLQRPSRIELLEHRGVAHRVAELLADRFGGNPLVLQLLANVVREMGEQAVLERSEEGAGGPYPQALVEGLLYRRILKHLEPEVARYAQLGLVLPTLTRDLIRFVLAPANDEPAMSAERADEIFTALSRTTWLFATSSDDTMLTQLPDMRRLIMQLVHSDLDKASNVRALHEEAINYHRYEQRPPDETLALYHELMLVQERSDLATFESRELGEALRALRPHLDELPVLAQSYVQQRMVHELGPDAALEALPDSAWERYLVGEGGEPGYGDQVVMSSDPLIALSLWRRRPVGPPGRPPTFVLQALAETAEWEDESADIARIVDELEAAPHNAELLRRLTALTRLALLQRPAPLSDAHASLIRRTLEGRWRAGTVAELCAIAAVAEALGNDPLVPPAYLEGDGALASETRLYLVHTWRFRKKFRWTPHLDALVTIQHDWTARVAAFGAFLEADSLREAVAVTEELHGAPLDAVTRALQKLRRPVPLRIKPDRDHHAVHVLLLRGPTPEFYRPVRQALREAFSSAQQIEELMAALRPQLSICPRDLEPRTFAQRAEHDPVSSFLALAAFVDRARTMGALLNWACQLSPASKLQRVRVAWQQWDLAIGQGISSDWWS